MKARWIALAAGLFSGYFSPPLFGQAASFPDAIKSAFSLDQELINGIQVYNRYLKAKGHPYFGEDRFLDGSVSIHGRVFQGLSLKYDIYAQCLELEYRYFSGGSNRLILISDHIDEFTVGEHFFQKIDFEDERRFCQVIRTAHFSCIVHWEKKLSPLKYETEFTDQFTQASPGFQLRRQGEVHEFKGRATFSNLFPVFVQEKIRKWLVRENISFRKATPEEITRAMQGVSALLAAEGIS